MIAQAPFPMQAMPPSPIDRLLNAPLPPLDEVARERARARHASLTKPEGALGALEGLVLDLAAATGTPRPRLFPRAVLLFACDHPVADRGVSAYPRAVTRAMVTNFVTGGAAASVLSRHLDATLHVIDVGVDGGGIDPRVVRDPVAECREGDVVLEDAMDEATFAAAVEAGFAAVDRCPDARAIVLGEMGIANTTLASAVAAAVLGGAGRDFVGRGTGVDDEALLRKREVVDDALARLSPVSSPLEILRRLGGRSLAAMAGAAFRAAERRTVVVVDGFVVSAALLALVRARPDLLPFLVFGHRSAEPAHEVVLSALGVRPLLDLGLRLGEGSGALLALPLLDAALAVHDEMATFASAGVPDRERG